MKTGNRASAKANLTEGAVGPLLIRLTLPMVFGIVSMGLYNIVDTFFVGQLGKEQLAALAFTFPVVMVVQSLALGIGMGSSALISRALGEGNLFAVRRYATDSLTLGLLIVALCAGAGILTIDPLFRLLGARGAVLGYIREYMRIWYPGVLFVVVPMIGNNAIRATGDTRTPGTVMVIGALTNAMLDPLLIFGLGPFPAFGITGAAVATLLGRSVTFTVALYVLIHRENLLIFRPPSLSTLLDSWREILHIGIPNAGAKMIVPLGAGVVTRVLAGLGPAVVAGYGVATRVEFFSLSVVNALASVVGPFIGQNIGAGRAERVKEGFRIAELFCLVIGFFLFLLFLFAAPLVAGLFNSDSTVVATTSRYLRIVSLSYGLQGFYVIVVAGLNVLKRPLKAATLSLMQMFAFTIPFSLLGSHLFGLSGIFGGILLSYTLTGLLSRRILMGELRHTR